MREDHVSDESEEDAESQRWPIGFMIIVGITAIYVGWRIIQGLGSLLGRLAT